MPAYPSLFHQLSMTVCGYADLNEDLSNEYWNILSGDAATLPQLTRMLDMYDHILQANPPDILAEFRNQVLPDAALRELLRKIIKTWYLGRPPVAPAAPLNGPRFFYHYEALIWKVAHAHPPGLSGGYYGYWHYKPEN